MDKLTFKRRALWIAGTLLLGALGSGIWEALLKPSVVWSGTLLLDIATLGVSGLRDGLYLDVAKGTYERAALSMMGLLFGGLAGIFTGLLLRRFRRLEGAGTDLQRKRRWALMAILVSLPMILFVQFFRINYVVRAANHLEQMKRIVAPHISTQELFAIDSRIAQMTTRHEYFTITIELREIAQQHKAKVPEFSIY